MEIAGMNREPLITKGSEGAGRMGLGVLLRKMGVGVGILVGELREVVGVGRVGWIFLERENVDVRAGL